jgi:hypothetical protein
LGLERKSVFFSDAFQLFFLSLPACPTSLTREMKMAQETLFAALFQRKMANRSERQE